MTTPRVEAKEPWAAVCNLSYLRKRFHPDDEYMIHQASTVSRREGVMLQGIK